MTGPEGPSASHAEDLATWRLLLRSFGTLVAGESAGRVFGLAVVVLLARHLGPAGFGLTAVGAALVQRFTLVSDAGTEILTLRNVAREPERFRELAQSILGLRIALSIAATGIYVAGIYAFSSSPLDRGVYLRFALVLPAVALNLRWIMLGVRGAPIIAAANVAGHLTILLAVLLLVVPTDDVLRAPYAYAAGELVYALAVLALIAPRFGLLVPHVDLAFWRSALRESYPLMVHSLARSLPALELALITFVLGPASAGFYSAGSRPFLFFSTAVGLFYLTFISSYSSTSGPRAVALFRRSARTALAVTLAAAVALTVGAGAVVPVVFGDRYSHAAPVLAILAWQLPLGAVSAPYGGLLVVENLQRVMMRNALVVAAFAVVGDLVAVWTVGINGVAVMSVAAAALNLALNQRAAVSRGLAPSLRVLVQRGATPGR